MGKKQNRINKIIEYIEANKEVSVDNLSSAFGVSRETVRRDLSNLEEQNLIIRKHGKAMMRKVPRNEQLEYPLAIRENRNTEIKKELCKYAASLINDNEAIFIDNSSTTSFILDYINPHLRLTVITNSYNLLTKAIHANLSNVQIICLGGVFNASSSSNYSFTGMVTSRNAMDYYPNKAFISSAAIRSDGTLTDIGTAEKEIKQIMLERSRETYILLDHSKLHQEGQISVATLNEKMNLIVDEEMKNTDGKIIESWPCTVHTVTPSQSQEFEDDYY